MQSYVLSYWTTYVPICIFLFHHLRRPRQGIAEHNLGTVEKNDFFVTLRRLAGQYGRLPDSMIITEKIEVSNQVLASGGFADVRTGTYEGHLVAVKTIRVSEQVDFRKIRRVSINDLFLSLGTRSQSPCSSNFARKSSSGTHYPIRMFWDSLEFGEIWRKGNLLPCQSGWRMVTSWSTSRITTLTDWNWCVLCFPNRFLH